MSAVPAFSPTLILDPVFTSLKSLSYSDGSFFVYHSDLQVVKVYTLLPSGLPTGRGSYTAHSLVINKNPVNGLAITSGQAYATGKLGGVYKMKFDETVGFSFCDDFYNTSKPHTY